MTPRTSGISQRLAQAEAAGDLAAAQQCAEQMLAANCTDEQHHRTLMRLHYLRGDSAQALATYERLREMLQREFAALPSSETEALVRTIRDAGETRAQVPATYRRQPPAALLRPPRLVGRDRELAAIARVWQSQRVFVLVGEAGLGKSRMLDEVALQYQGCVVAQARPGDASTPYASLARLLRALIKQCESVVQTLPRSELSRLLPEIGLDLATLPDGRRLWLQSAVESLLQAAASNGVRALLFDDLHFADVASLETLQSLLLGDGSGTLQWGLAQRPAEPNHATELLQSALEETGRGETLKLGPLDRSSLEALIDSLGMPELEAARLAPQLARHTGGNPLYALETLKSVWAQGAVAGPLPRPSSVAALIDRRLRQLSPAALSLARVAAVASIDFTIELAEQVLEMRALAFADAWGELQGAQVMRGGAFAHDLVFEATLASIPEPIARHTHASVARHMEAHAGEPARIARHWISAGQPTRALQALHAAAESAGLAMRPREQAQFLEQAAGIERDAGQGDVAFSSLRDAVAARFMADRTELDDASLDRLLAAATTKAQRAAALRLRSEVLTARGDYAAVIAATDEALQLVDDDEGLRGELLQTQGGALSMRGDFERAVQVLQLAAPWVTNHGSGSQRLAFHGDLAVVLDNADRYLDAQPEHRRALALALEHGEHANAVIILSNLAVSLNHTGDLEQATEALIRAERLAAAHDEARGAACVIPSMLSRCLRDQCQYTESLRWAEIGLRELQAQAPAWVGAMHVHMANTYVVLGQHARAWQSLAQAGVPEQMPPWQASAYWLAQARLKRALGQPHGEALAAAVAMAPSEGRRPLRAAITLEQALSLPSEAALPAVEQVLAEAETHHLRGVRLSALIRLCALSAAAGPSPAAVESAEAALALAATSHPDELYRGELWLLAGRAFERSGDTTRAGELFAAGARWVHEVTQQHVPAEFKDSFLTRNAVNRELLAAARRAAQHALAPP